MSEKKPRFRIDFSIRELDVPEETARGIRFGDDVDIDAIAEFFNKHRDLARTLFQSVQKPRSSDVVQQDILRLLEERKQAEERENKEAAHTMKQISDLAREKNVKVLMPQAPSNRYAGKSRRELDRMDDGSRGGDGPSDPDYVEAYRHAADLEGWPRY